MSRKPPHCETCSCPADEGLFPWKVAAPIGEALAKTRFVALTGEERWWKAQFRAHNGTNFAKELLEAEAWCTSNPARAPRKDFRRFLNEWFKRAAVTE